MSGDHEALIATPTLALDVAVQGLAVALRLLTADLVAGQNVPACTLVADRFALHRVRLPVTHAVRDFRAQRLTDRRR